MQPADADYIVFCAEKMAKERDSSLMEFWLESLKEHIRFISTDVADIFITSEILAKEGEDGLRSF